ncbi:MAG TPA: rhodanese-related sulfurtransferase [Candidatus Saccharimonadales bacterium]|nr:rhodanese-related sulfurtransferase [Candidatus Saccharimonadales bacterium]
MEKIILYYKFVPVADPETVMHWQKTLAGDLGLRGRILISKHGINGTLGGDVEALKSYVKAMNLHSSFKNIKYKWSDGGVSDFPRLSVKVRDEIVTFGVPEEIKVDESGVVGGGKHLKPHEVHKLVKERGEEVVFMDGRNAYEAAIGKFKNAKVPNTRTTRDFIKELEKPEYKELKDKPIVTYCTGGIRCEILSTLMKNRGFSEVYQIDGGIAKYGGVYGDDGFWEGKMYVFDKRMKVTFSDKSKDIGQCVHCESKTSNYENCALKSCNNLVLICEDCLQNDTTCSTRCAQELAAQAV